MPHVMRGTARAFSDSLPNEQRWIAARQDLLWVEVRAWGPETRYEKLKRLLEN